MKTVKIIIIFVAVVTMLSCGLLISPKRGHENPLDPENPVGMISNFLARLITESEVELTWDSPPGEQTPEDLELVIIRKVGSPPTSRGDGQMLDGVAVNSGSYNDGGVVPFENIYYAAWTYSPSMDQYTGTEYAWILTVPPLQFRATALGGDQVRLSWNTPGKEIGKMSVVRKFNSEPLSPTDGTTLPVDLMDGEFWDFGVGINNEYFYGAWWTDDSGDEVYTSELDGTVTSFIWLSVYPTADGWVDSNNTVDFGGEYLRITGTSFNPRRYSLFRFDNMPPGYLGNLIVRPGNWSFETSAYLNRIKQDWSPDDSGLYSTVSSSSFIAGPDYSNYMDSYPEYCQISGMIWEWATGTPHYGIRMYYGFGSQWLEMYSSRWANENFRPYLRVWCSTEFE